MKFAQYAPRIVHSLQVSKSTRLLMQFLISTQSPKKLLFFSGSKQIEVVELNGFVPIFFKEIERASNVCSSFLDFCPSLIILWGKLCYCCAETRRGHLPDWWPRRPPRRMQVADWAEKVWPHNEEANLDNVQQKVSPLLSLTWGVCLLEHLRAFISNAVARQCWCSLPLAWPWWQQAGGLVLSATAAAWCKVYPNFRRLSRAAIPWHPTLTIALRPLSLLLSTLSLSLWRAKPEWVVSPWQGIWCSNHTINISVSLFHQTHNCTLYNTLRQI